jgi:RHS repeat-associated protein
MTTYAYDGLNRVLSKTYSDATVVRFAYDTIWKGMPSSVSSPASTTTYDGYDSLGRVKHSTQAVTGNGSYAFSYTYNKAGALATETYPSGRVVSVGYDVAGRPTSLLGSYNGNNVNYATGILYASHGPVAQETLANGALTEVRGYSGDRQQLVSVTAGSLSLSYSYCPNGASSCASNNGNVMRQVTGGLTQDFGYTDPCTGKLLNRLGSAVESGGPNEWNQYFCADSYGNRWVNSSSGLPYSSFTPTAAANFDSKNRLQIQGSAYDSSGNLQTIGAFGFQYDAENRQTSMTNGSTATYSYDGDGHRVMKVSGGVTTIYVYDARGELAAEYSTSASSLPCKTCYLVTDALGSTRMVANESGVPKSFHDFAPFGEEIPAGVGGRSSLYGSSDLVTQKFTGKERDSETASSGMADGLDYFGARYYSGAQGRFTSPDVINLTSARLLNPSNTLNKYVYAANNPLTYVDPDGLDITLYYRPPSGAPMDFGHVFLGALNQSSAEVAFLDYYPPDGTNGFGSGRGEFNPGDMQDRAGQNYASLTIQTTPEQAQNVINVIKGLKNGTPAAYSALSHNCTTVCQDALADLGLSLGDITPTGFWNDVFQRYSAAAVARKQRGFVGTIQNFFQPLRPVSRPGTEFGVPRNFGPGNFDLFYLYFNQLANPQPRACVEVSDSATGTQSKQCQ